MVLKRWNGAAFEDVDANDNWETNANSTDIQQTSMELGAFTLTDLSGGSDNFRVVNGNDHDAQYDCVGIRGRIVFWPVGVGSRPGSDPAKNGGALLPQPSDWTR